MTTMITEVYKAFVEAGTPEQTAREAAEAIASHDGRLNSLDSNIKLLVWMVGFNLTFSAAVLWRLIN